MKCASQPFLLMLNFTIQQDLFQEAILLDLDHNRVHRDFELEQKHKVLQPKHHHRSIKNSISQQQPNSISHDINIMNNSIYLTNSIRSPKQRILYSVYTSTNNRNYTQPKPRVHLKLPNCSPNRTNSNKPKNFYIRSRQRSQQQSPATRIQVARNRDSSESFMKELELSGNEDLKDINRSLLLTSQEINKKMQFSIESYLNNTLKKKQTCIINNLFDFDLTQDVYEYSKTGRRRLTKK